MSPVQRRSDTHRLERHNVGPHHPHALEFAHHSDGWTMWLALITLVLLGLLTFAVVDRLATGAGSPTVVGLTVAVLALAVCTLPTAMFDHLHAVLRVFVLRRSPQAAVAAAKRRFLTCARALTLGGAAVSAMAVSMGLPTAGHPPPDALAAAVATALAMALAICTAWVTLGAWRGWLPAVLLLMPALALGWLGLVGVKAAAAMLFQWPAVALLGALLASLALADHLQRRALRAANPPQPDGLCARRFTAPQAAWQQFSARWLRSQSLLGGSMFPVLVVNPMQWLNNGRWAPPRFEDLVTSGDLMRLLLFFIVVFGVMQVSGLHWRHALAPGGRYRHRLGWNIVRSTWLAVTGFALVLLSAMWLVVRLFFSEANAAAAKHVTGLDLGDVVVHAPVLALELLLVCTMAAAVAGVKPHWPVRTFFVTLGVLVASIVAVALLLPADSSVRSIPLWTMGWGHVAGLLFASLAFGWLAAQRWRRVDLGMLLRMTKRRDLHDEGGFPHRA